MGCSGTMAQPRTSSILRDPGRDYGLSDHQKRRRAELQYRPRAQWAAPVRRQRVFAKPIGGPPFLDQPTIDAISAWITAGAKQFGDKGPDA
jgi:hypothetical protein